MGCNVDHCCTTPVQQTWNQRDMGPFPTGSLIYPHISMGVTSGSIPCLVAVLPFGLVQTSS